MRSNNQVFCSVPGFLFCIALAMVVLLQGGCKSDSGQAQKPALPVVKVYTVTLSDVPFFTELPGRARAFNVSEVRPQVTGIILNRLFQEGTNVEKGQQLYQIDPAIYEANYNTALANQQRAEAALGTAKLLADRYARIVKSNAVSKQEYDDAMAAYRQAEAELAAMKAAVQTAKINLDYTKVFAPVSGRIGISNVTEGALVTATQATPLAYVQQMDPMNIDIVQSSKDYLRLQRGVQSGMVTPGTLGEIPVTLLLEDGKPFQQKANLKLYDVNIDQSTGSITMRAEVENPNSLIMPGMFVRAIVNQGTLKNAILVPQQAVAFNTKGLPYALVVDKTGMVETRVFHETLGEYQGSWVITPGLSNEAAETVTEEDAIKRTKQGQPVYGLMPGDRVIMEGTMNPAVKGGAEVDAQEFVLQKNVSGALIPNSKVDDKSADGQAAESSQKSNAKDGKLKAGGDAK